MSFGLSVKQERNSIEKRERLKMFVAEELCYELLAKYNKPKERIECFKRHLLNEDFSVVEKAEILHLCFAKCCVNFNAFMRRFHLEWSKGLEDDNVKKSVLLLISKVVAADDFELMVQVYADFIQYPDIDWDFKASVFHSIFENIVLGDIFDGPLDNILQ